MALPKINDVPIYYMTIPSTGQKVSYRPFLVKEQKVLLIALETGEIDHILRAIMDSIAACVQEPIDVNTLATFDIEYMFIRIRMKSAGETSIIRMPCNECQEYTEINIPLEDVKIDLPEKVPSVQLTDSVNLKLRYPRYNALLEEAKNTDQSEVDALYGLIYECLDHLETEEERISFRDETRESVETFLNELTTGQFDNIVAFTQKLPRLSHEIHFNCEACSKENNFTLEGLQDFFQLPSPTTA